MLGRPLSTIVEHHLRLQADKSAANISVRAFEADEILDQDHADAIPRKALSDAAATVQAMRRPGEQRVSDSSGVGLDRCAATVSGLLATGAGFDPTLHIGKDILAEVTRLKPFRQGRATGALVTAVRGDVWELWVEAQLASLDVLDHSGWEVREVHQYHRKRDRRTHVEMFVVEVKNLLKDDALFRARFGFKVRHRMTMELLTMLKLDGEFVLLCDENKRVIMVRASHKKNVEDNGKRCREIGKRITLGEEGEVWLSQVGPWSVIAFVYCAVTLGSMVGVAVKNPAKRDNWFEVVSDCLTVAIIALGTVVGFFGLRGDLVDNFWNALTFRSAWKTERDIVKDLGREDTDKMKTELTNSYPAKLMRMFADVNGCFAIGQLSGTVSIERGWYYDPCELAGSTIVGYKGAYNIVANQYYRAEMRELGSDLDMHLTKLDAVEYSAIVGLQRPAYVGVSDQH